MEASSVNNKKESQRIRHEQYKIERELADRLRHASKSERRMLYTSVYNELYQRVPEQSQLVRKRIASSQESLVNYQMLSLHWLLECDTIFLEVGPGDCALSIQVAGLVSKVFAIDVSMEIADSVSFPENFRLLISDGSSIPVEQDSITLAYSNQLMEHLHPDDAMDQLQNIHRALAPGGKYLCVTPNRLSGPHDVSRGYDKIATGFHLKEYSIRELHTLFLTARFSRVQAVIGTKGFNLLVPVILLETLELFLSHFPGFIRRSVMSHFPFKLINTIRLLGVK